MKSIWTLLLLIGIFPKLFGQDIENLEDKLTRNELTVHEKIETLNLLSRGLTFINPIKAVTYANEALRLSTETDNQVGIAYAYRNLSNSYSYNESYFISMEYLQRAMDIFSNIRDSVGIANCYISLGHTYRGLQNRGEEIKYNKMSFDLFTRLKIIERIGVTSHNLGESYLNNGDIEKSRQLTLMAIQINDSINNEAVLSSCYKVLGIIEFLENDLNSAEEHFNKALKISENLGLNSQKVATIESIIKLASISKQKKDFKAQLKYLLMAAEYSKKNNLPTHLQIAYNELMMFYSLRNKQELVQKYIIAYRSISDSLNQKQLNDRYNLTNSIVQVHELYKTKNELEKMNFLQSQRIKNRNIILLIITISIIALVFLLFKLYTTIKKLKIQNLTIESQKANLEVLNNTKDKFFSIVAHDLKSPLNSLKAFSSLLIDHYDLLSKEEILNMSQQLKISVDNTIKMADNLIMWARIQMSDIQFKEEVIKVKDIASNICDVYNDVALTKGINVSCTVDDSLVITGDKNQIEFVIRNLVNNAIKFTHKDGLVRLTAKALADGQVQISVSDSGVGISDEIKSKLFSIGKKQSTNGTDGEKGTGLGLMLSHEFIKLNGGQIDIESIVGKGTTFNVKFNSGQ